MKPRKAATPAVRSETGITESQKADFLESFAREFSLVQAADDADLTGEQLRKAFAEDREFYEDYRALQTREGEKVQKAMIDRALKGDPACARLVLPALLPELYGNRVTIDININRPEELEAVDDEKLAEIEATCLKLQSS